MTVQLTGKITVGSSTTTLQTHQTLRLTSSQDADRPVDNNDAIPTHTIVIDEFLKRDASPDEQITLHLRTGRGDFLPVVIDRDILEKIKNLAELLDKELILLGLRANMMEARNIILELRRDLASRNDEIKLLQQQFSAIKTMYRRPGSGTYALCRTAVDLGIKEGKLTTEIRAGQNIVGNLNKYISSIEQLLSETDKDSENPSINVKAQTNKIADLIISIRQFQRAQDAQLFNPNMPLPDETMATLSTQNDTDIALAEAIRPYTQLDGRRLQPHMTNIPFDILSLDTLVTCWEQFNTFKDSTEVQDALKTLQTSLVGVLRKDTSFWKWLLKMLQELTDSWSNRLNPQSSQALTPEAFIAQTVLPFELISAQLIEAIFFELNLNLVKTRRDEEIKAFDRAVEVLLRHGDFITIDLTNAIERARFHYIISEQIKTCGSEDKPYEKWLKNLLKTQYFLLYPSENHKKNRPFDQRLVNAYNNFFCTHLSEWETQIDATNAHRITEAAQQKRQEQLIKKPVNIKPYNREKYSINSADSLFLKNYIEHFLLPQLQILSPSKTWGTDSDTEEVVTVSEMQNYLYQILATLKNSNNLTDIVLPISAGADCFVQVYNQAVASFNSLTQSTSSSTSTSISSPLPKLVTCAELFSRRLADAIPIFIAQLAGESINSQLLNQIQRDLHLIYHRQSSIFNNLTDIESETLEQLIVPLVTDDISAIAKRAQNRTGSSAEDTIIFTREDLQNIGHFILRRNADRTDTEAQLGGKACVIKFVTHYYQQAHALLLEIKKTDLTTPFEALNKLEKGTDRYEQARIDFYALIVKYLHVKNQNEQQSKRIVENFKYYNSILKQNNEESIATRYEPVYSRLREQISQSIGSPDTSIIILNEADCMLLKLAESCSETKVIHNFINKHLETYNGGNIQLIYVIVFIGNTEQKKSYIEKRLNHLFSNSDRDISFVWLELVLIKEVGKETFLELVIEYIQALESRNANANANANAIKLLNVYDITREIFPELLYIIKPVAMKQVVNFLSEEKKSTCIQDANLNDIIVTILENRDSNVLYDDEYQIQIIDLLERQLQKTPNSSRVREVLYILLAKHATLCKVYTNYILNPETNCEDNIYYTVDHVFRIDETARLKIEQNRSDTQYIFNATTTEAANCVISILNNVRQTFRQNSDIQDNFKAQFVDNTSPILALEEDNENEDDIITYRWDDNKQQLIAYFGGVELTSNWLAANVTTLQEILLPRSFELDKETEEITDTYQIIESLLSDCRKSRDTYEQISSLPLHLARETLNIRNTYKEILTICRKDLTRIERNQAYGLFELYAHPDEINELLAIWFELLVTDYYQSNKTTEIENKYGLALEELHNFIVQIVKKDGLATLPSDNLHIQQIINSQLSRYLKATDVQGCRASFENPNNQLMIRLFARNPGGFLCKWLTVVIPRFQSKTEIGFPQRITKNYHALDKIIRYAKHEIINEADTTDATSLAKNDTKIQELLINYIEELSGEQLVDNFPIDLITTFGSDATILAFRFKQAAYYLNQLATRAHLMAKSLGNTAFDIADSIHGHIREEYDKACDFFNELNKLNADAENHENNNLYEFLMALSVLIAQIENIHADKASGLTRYNQALDLIQAHKTLANERGWARFLHNINVKDLINDMVLDPALSNCIVIEPILELYATYDVLLQYHEGRVLVLLDLLNQQNLTPDSLTTFTVTENGSLQIIICETLQACIAAYAQYRNTPQFQALRSARGLDYVDTSTLCLTKTIQQALLNYFSDIDRSGNRILALDQTIWEFCLHFADRGNLISLHELVLSLLLNKKLLRLSDNETEFEEKYSNHVQDYIAFVVQSLFTTDTQTRANRIEPECMQTEGIGRLFNAAIRGESIDGQPPTWDENLENLIDVFIPEYRVALFAQRLKNFLSNANRIEFGLEFSDKYSSRSTQPIIFNDNIYRLILSGLNLIRDLSSGDKLLNDKRVRAVWKTIYKNTSSITPLHIFLARLFDSNESRVHCKAIQQLLLSPEIGCAISLQTFICNLDERLSQSRAHQVTTLQLKTVQSFPAKDEDVFTNLRKNKEAQAHFRQYITEENVVALSNNFDDPGAQDLFNERLLLASLFANRKNLINLFSMKIEAALKSGEFTHERLVQLENLLQQPFSELPYTQTPTIDQFRGSRLLQAFLDTYLDKYVTFFSAELDNVYALFANQAILIKYLTQRVSTILKDSIPLTERDINEILASLSLVAEKRGINIQELKIILREHKELQEILHVYLKKTNIIYQDQADATDTLFVAIANNDNLELLLVKKIEMVLKSIYHSNTELSEQEIIDIEKIINNLLGFINRLQDRVSFTQLQKNEDLQKVLVTFGNNFPCHNLHERILLAFANNRNINQYRYAKVLPKLATDNNIQQTLKYFKLLLKDTTILLDDTKVKLPARPKCISGANQAVYCKDRATTTLKEDTRAWLRDHMPTIWSDNYELLVRYYTRDTALLEEMHVLLIAHLASINYSPEPAFATSIVRDYLLRIGGKAIESKKLVLTSKNQQKVDDILSHLLNQKYDPKNAMLFAAVASEALEQEFNFNRLCELVENKEGILPLITEEYAQENNLQLLRLEYSLYQSIYTYSKKITTNLAQLKAVFGDRLHIIYNLFNLNFHEKKLRANQNIYWLYTLVVTENFCFTYSNVNERRTYELYRKFQTFRESLSLEEIQPLVMRNVRFLAEHDDFDNLFLGYHNHAIACDVYIRTIDGVCGGLFQSTTVGEPNQTSILDRLIDVTRTETPAHENAAIIPQDVIIPSERKAPLNTFKAYLAALLEVLKENIALISLCSAEKRKITAAKNLLSDEEQASVEQYQSDMKNAEYRIEKIVEILQLKYTISNLPQKKLTQDILETTAKHESLANLTNYLSERRHQINDIYQTLHDHLIAIANGTNARNLSIDVIRSSLKALSTRDLACGASLDFQRKQIIRDLLLQIQQNLLQSVSEEVTAERGSVLPITVPYIKEFYQIPFIRRTELALIKEKVNPFITDTQELLNNLNDPNDRFDSKEIISSYIKKYASQIADISQGQNKILLQPLLLTYYLITFYACAQEIEMTLSLNVQSIDYKQQLNELQHLDKVSGAIFTLTKVVELVKYSDKPIELNSKEQSLFINALQSLINPGENRLNVIDIQYLLSLLQQGITAVTLAKKDALLKKPVRTTAYTLREHCCITVLNLIRDCFIKNTVDVEAINQALFSLKHCNALIQAYNKLMYNGIDHFYRPLYRLEPDNNQRLLDRENNIYILALTLEGNTIKYKSLNRRNKTVTNIISAEELERLGINVSLLSPQNLVKQLTPYLNDILTITSDRKTRDGVHDTYSPPRLPTAENEFAPAIDDLLLLCYGLPSAKKDEFRIKIARILSSWEDLDTRLAKTNSSLQPSIQPIASNDLHIRQQLSLARDLIVNPELTESIIAITRDLPRDLAGCRQGVTLTREAMTAQIEKLRELIKKIAINPQQDEFLAALTHREKLIETSLGELISNRLDHAFIDSLRTCFYTSCSQLTDEMIENVISLYKTAITHHKSYELFESCLLELSEATSLEENHDLIDALITSVKAVKEDTTLTAVVQAMLETHIKENGNARHRPLLLLIQKLLLSNLADERNAILIDAQYKFTAYLNRLTDSDDTIDNPDTYFIQLGELIGILKNDDLLHAEQELQNCIDSAISNGSVNLPVLELIKILLNDSFNKEVCAHLLTLQYQFNDLLNSMEMNYGFNVETYPARLRNLFSIIMSHPILKAQVLSQLTERIKVRENELVSSPYFDLIETMIFSIRNNFNSVDYEALIQRQIEFTVCLEELGKSNDTNSTEMYQKLYVIFSALMKDYPFLNKYIQRQLMPYSHKGIVEEKGKGTNNKPDIISLMLYLACQELKDLINVDLTALIQIQIDFTECLDVLRVKPTSEMAIEKLIQLFNDIMNNYPILKHHMRPQLAQYIAEESATSPFFSVLTLMLNSIISKESIKAGFTNQVEMRYHDCKLLLEFEKSYIDVLITDNSIKQENESVDDAAERLYNVVIAIKNSNARELYAHGNLPARRQENPNSRYNEILTLINNMLTNPDVYVVDCDQFKHLYSKGEEAKSNIDILPQSNTESVSASPAAKLPTPRSFSSNSLSNVLSFLTSAIRGISPESLQTTATETSVATPQSTGSLSQPASPTIRSSTPTINIIPRGRSNDSTASISPLSSNPTSSFSRLGSNLSQNGLFFPNSLTSKKSRSTAKTPPTNVTRSTSTSSSTTVAPTPSRSYSPSNSGDESTSSDDLSKSLSESSKTTPGSNSPSS